MNTRRPDAAARGLVVALATAPASSELEVLWRRLETQADASFFTSWSWIGCWLRGIQPLPQLLCATRDGEVVGLALWASHLGRRLKLLPSRGMYLHATGDPKKDEITIEHNGFLVHRDGSAEIEAAMYDRLLNHAGRWDRLVLPGLSGRPALAGALPPGVALRELEHQSYFVDLREVRRRDGDYLGMLSSNTRQQIRRSIKAYEKLGPVTLTEAPDLETALAYLAALRGLHERRWLSKGEPGAFSDPFFQAFHTQLMHSSFGRGEIQLLRIQAGAHDLGYLYSFVHRGRVFFYQSGFDYELLQAQSRPGLVAHALAVSHNARRGLDVYDFLAGTARYKLSLASGEEPMVWTVVHRRTLAFRLEQVLRGARRRWRAARAGAISDTSPSTVGSADIEAHPPHLGPPVTAPAEPRDKR